jgi:hypothetical protein
MQQVIQNNLIKMTLLFIFCSAITLTRCESISYISLRNGYLYDVEIILIFQDQNKYFEKK